MGNTAGQLPDCFHLLALPERFLDPLALRDGLVDPTFERLVEFVQGRVTSPFLRDIAGLDDRSDWLPLFVEQGTRVKVDTRNGDYLGRVSE